MNGSRIVLVGIIVWRIVERHAISAQDQRIPSSTLFIIDILLGPNRQDKGSILCQGKTVCREIICMTGYSVKVLIDLVIVEAIHFEQSKVPLLYMLTADARFRSPGVSSQEFVGSRTGKKVQFHHWSRCDLIVVVSQQNVFRAMRSIEY